ncbi:2-C-methyl-D-erythritol 4-phosphate cytidylyltransferase [Mucilaginibacter gracilis]|uniref:2-C-methyl-D-erythritol 4-phosphate cytidylyltransferase n=1 Tax=Mucilaginibacter gracilis TaxID=423350 RepID=A0A495J368_9SPHI|nr:2-C-methyl-D-erythritol 4-phosphate cytidylyltransferase [Mucilaginibacter gracilis]RKR83425.1 2-C-methyl-D-erythritol 4-phosphate cytidylyltransferase [Mucilaginibacter gracilis]
MAANNLDTQYALSNTTYYAIIVAGGSGSRMQSALPKQFLLLNGKPVLMYTVEAFYKSNSRPSIIIVLPKDYHQYWLELCKDHDFRIPHHLVNGGDTRFQSVKNGLALIDNPDAVIAVHDAVRPLTQVTAIDNAFTYAQQHGNAIVAVKSRDSIRQLKNGISAALIRNEIYLVQTPQTFQSGLLRRAYQQPYRDDFTDDASVVECLGININIIEGSYTNLKITFPEDIAIAEMLLSNQQ